MNKLTKVGQKSLQNIQHREIALADCFDQKPLVRMKKEEPIKEIADAIIRELKKLAILYGWKVNDQWYKLFFDMILDSYPMETLNDIVLVLRNGASGKYKKPIGILDPVTFKEWMAVHLEEKYRERERRLQEEKTNQGEALQFIYDGIKKKAPEFIKKITGEIKRPGMPGLDQDKLHKMRLETHKKNKVGHDIPKNILEKKTGK